MRSHAIATLTWRDDVHNEAVSQYAVREGAARAMNGAAWLTAKR